MYQIVKYKANYLSYAFRTRIKEIFFWVKEWKLYGIVQYVRLPILSVSIRLTKLCTPIKQINYGEAFKKA